MDSESLEFHLDQQFSTNNDFASLAIPPPQDVWRGLGHLGYDAGGGCHEHLVGTLGMLWSITPPGTEPWPMSQEQR